MLEAVTALVLALLAVSVALCLYRVVAGPSLPDRVVALDTVGLNVVAMILVVSVRQATRLYLDATLVIAILGFLGTVAIARFLARGVIIDRHPD